MEYNTARNQLILPEYGRHVQKMVEYATTLNDKKERTKCVNAIIDFMGQMNPHLRDIKEFTHKLWDHLYIMSEFKIDAETPYPIPEIEKLQKKKKKMPYPNNKIKFPFYGAALENMIRFTVAMDEGRQKEIMTGMVANHMKKSYLLFNKHSVNNDTIKLHLDQLSNNKLKIPADFEFIRSESVVTRNPKE